MDCDAVVGPLGRFSRTASTITVIPQTIELEVVDAANDYLPVWTLFISRL
jgi:hypothetical protein